MARDRRCSAYPPGSAQLPSQYQYDNDNANIHLDSYADYASYLALVLYLTNVKHPPRRLVSVPVEGGRMYSFMPKVNTKSCMDLKGNNPANHTTIQEYTCNGTEAQIFEVVPNGLKIPGCTSGAACAKLFNLVHPDSGKCADVFVNVPSPGQDLNIYDCNDTRAQRFTFVGDGSGYVTIRWPIKSSFGEPGQASDWCMEVTNAGTANGTQVQVNPCNGSDRQKWVAIPAD